MEIEEPTEPVEPMEFMKLVKPIKHIQPELMKPMETATETHMNPWNKQIHETRGTNEIKECEADGTLCVMPVMP